MSLMLEIGPKGKTVVAVALDYATAACRQEEILVVPRNQSDEAYVIGLCDQVLGLAAQRQATFDFLRGDARPGKQGLKLRVDAYYPSLDLVIEYRERQHTESVPIMDQRMTVSGVQRGEQRALYDQRRRDLLPAHGLTLVELSYEQFGCTRGKRLLRQREADLLVVREVLAEWITAKSPTGEVEQRG